MAAKPGKGRAIRTSLLGVMLAALLPAGCTGARGTPLLLFPQRETRSISARAQQPAAGPATQSLTQERAPVALPPHAVEPGDRLLVQPAEGSSPLQLPGEQAVQPDGTISLGRYGQLRVLGKTSAQIERMAQTVIHAQTKNTGRIQVHLVPRDSQVYQVLGEVNAPGTFPLQGQQTVLDAIVAAGGLTDRAAPRSILLARATGPNQCRIVLPVSYQEIVQGGDSARNYPLAPGDRIFVARKSPPELSPQGGGSTAQEHRVVEMRKLPLAPPPPRLAEGGLRVADLKANPSSGTPQSAPASPYAMSVVSVPVKLPPKSVQLTGGTAAPAQGLPLIPEPTVLPAGVAVSSYSTVARPAHAPRDETPLLIPCRPLVLPRVMLGGACAR